jgi:hypothetical protein
MDKEDWSTESSTMSDIPIDSVNVSASLSLADASFSKTGDRSIHVETGETTSTEEQKRKARCAILFWVIVLFVIVLLVLILIINLSISSSSASNHQGPSFDPFDAVVEYFSTKHVSSYKDLTTEGTPQNKAALWLAVHEDETAANIPELRNAHEGYLYMTRYIMALNYYSMDGHNWVNQLNFLSSKPVCDWNGFKPVNSEGLYAAKPEYGGLQCDRVSGLPTELDLGESNWCYHDNG